MAPRERAGGFRLLRLMAQVCGILILLAVCAFALWRVVLYRDVSRRFASIRAAGYPVSGEELNSWLAPVPDAENGALVLTQAFALFRTFPDRRSNEVAESSLLNRANEWSAATRAMIEAYVQTNEMAVAKIREASLLPRFRYPVDFSYGPETPLPHLDPLKDLARVAALAAVLEAEEGLADKWPPLVELQLKLASTLDDEPIEISCLVRNSIIRMAVQATERSLNRANPGAEACKKLQAAFAHAGETNLLPRALIGERALTIPIFRISREEAQSFSDDDATATQPRKPQHYAGKPTSFFWVTGFFERDLDFYLQTMEKGISLSALPFPGSLSLTNYLESAGSIAEKRFYILSSMSLLSLSTSIVNEGTKEARSRLATTALAVERFRLERGQLPDDLRELTPKYLDAIPTDPFDGAPLKYHRLTRGYVIYSVGADGHDDGGREPPQLRNYNNKSTYDLTFVVER